jgi:hypothetical protein
MGLLAPTALFLLGLIPVLVLAYLVRERPRRITVSSVIAFRALGRLRGERPWGRPRLDWMFFVEAAILALAALAIAGPYLMHQSRPLAVLLDNSATMQARMPSGRTRLEAARERLAAMLEGDASGAQITLFVTAPEPHQVAGALSDIADIRSEIGRIAAIDAPDDPAATRRLLADLGSGRRFTETIFATSCPVAAPVPARIKTIVAGGPILNYALGAFSLRRESFGTDVLHGRITLGNFSPQPQTLAVAIIGDGREVARAEARLEGHEVGSLEFPSLAPADAYRAVLTPPDAFVLDNTAFATAHAVKSVDVLFISPTPADAQGLASLPGVAVRTQSPENFSPLEAAKADLVIFEYGAPKELPLANSLLVMPPPGDPVFNFAVRPASSIAITAWDSPAPLTDGVNFRLLDLRSGEYFNLHPWMQPAVDGAGGALMLYGDRQGHRYVATGFNPFPYLGRRNLPMSVLTLNILGYLAGLGADSGGYRTGEPWLVPAGIATVVMPSGARVAVHPGTLFSGDVAQGIYQLVGPGGQRTMRAVNFSDLAASDLENPAPLKLEVRAEEHAAAATSFKARQPLARYLIAALLAMAAGEAIVVYRRRRRFELVQA